MKNSVIGLTGVYCSGKSTVEIILRDDYHYTIIDVDKVGHEVLDEKKEELAREFGDHIITDNKVNRKVLGPIVFGDKKALLRLNALVHPAMIEKIKAQIKGSPDTNPDTNPDTKWCINAALLFEMGLDSLCGQVLVVKASWPTLFKRGKARDGHSTWRIIKILTTQKVLKLAKQKSQSVDICYVENNFGVKELKSQLQEIL